LARDAAEEGYELVVAVGGDGTVHEVVNGLMQVPKEKRPKLGVVPVGSGNDFANAVGYSKRAETALREALTGVSYRVDVGLIKDGNGRKEYWTNTLGIGFDATSTIRFRKMTRLRGFSAYLAAVLQTIVLNHDAAQIQVKTDEQDWNEDILMLVLCNGNREGGGFYVQPHAKPNDGKLHYVYIGKVSRLMMLRLLVEVMQGTHERFSEVEMGSFKKLELKSNIPLHIHTDGEIFAGFDSNVRELSVEIIPGAIEVVH
jgi:YegS/Rv2252/BmrU family lipid kinase